MPRFKSADEFRASRSPYRFEREFRAGTLFLPPAAPGATNWQTVPGPLAGQIVTSVISPPASVGDGSVQGDGAGVITGYQISIAGAAAVNYPASPLPEVTTSHTPGAQISVSLRAMGFGEYPNGRPGVLSIQTVTATPTPPVTPDVLINNLTGDTLIDKTSGARLIRA
jgi:hypothetical protein